MSGSVTVIYCLFFFFLLYGYLVSIIFRTCEYDDMKFMM